MGIIAFGMKQLTRCTVVLAQYEIKCSTQWRKLIQTAYQETGVGREWPVETYELSSWLICKRWHQVFTWGIPGSLTLEGDLKSAAFASEASIYQDRFFILKCADCKVCLLKQTKSVNRATVTTLSCIDFHVWSGLTLGKRAVLQCVSF